MKSKETKEKREGGGERKYDRASARWHLQVEVEKKLHFLNLNNNNNNKKPVKLGKNPVIPPPPRAIVFERDEKLGKTR